MPEILSQPAQEVELFSPDDDYHGAKDTPQRRCISYARCSASLCPLVERPKLLKLRGYFVDEDAICCNQKVKASDPLVDIQRRIAKAGATGLFTLKMLEAVAKLPEVPTDLEGLPLSAAAFSGPHRKAPKWIRELKFASEPPCEASNIAS